MKVTDFPLLLVEDDPDEIVRIQGALIQANLVNPLRIVKDGQQAISYLSGQAEYADRDLHPLPSLIVLDLGIAGSSGLDVMAFVRSQQNLKNLPVILLTPSTIEQGDSQPTQRLEEVPCLSKPVECGRLVEVLKSIGMYWLILDTPRPQAGPSSVAFQSRHVLVVDRDVDFTRSIGDALRRRTPSIEVDSALEAPAALNRLAQHPVDALVYERGIAEAEEFGFLGKVRRVKADLPIIVLCSERDDAFSVRAIQRGVTAVLIKKVRLDHFSDQLHALLVAAMIPASAGAAAPPDSKTTRGTPGSAPRGSPRKNMGSGRRQDTDILGNQIAFQNTAWDMVRAAPKPEALDALIRIYWKPLYFFVRQRGFSNEEAKDIVQDFLANALERHMITRADPLRGRFRSFLLAALTNFLKDRLRSLGRQKRGGGKSPLSLDLGIGEHRGARPADKGEQPETIVDREWAKGLLGKCISELMGKPSHLQAFDLQMQGVGLREHWECDWTH